MIVGGLTESCTKTAKKSCTRILYGQALDPASDDSASAACTDLHHDYRVATLDRSNGSTSSPPKASAVGHPSPQAKTTRAFPGDEYVAGLNPPGGSEIRYPAFWVSRPSSSLLAAGPAA